MSENANIDRTPHAHEHMDGLKADIEQAKNWSGYGLAALIIALLGAGMWCGKLTSQVEQMDKHLASIDARLEQAAASVGSQQRLEQRVNDLADEVERLRDDRGYGGGGRRYSVAPTVIPPRVPYTGSGRP